MRTLTIFLIGLIILSCQTTKNESSEMTITQSTEPSYELAIQFINDYLNFSNDLNTEVGLIEWIEKRNDVTVDFKNELKRIIEEAEKNDPELGLGFDPILNAQDSPYKFVFDKIESNYLTVKDEKWSDFKLTLKIKSKNDIWMIDGSGIINIPEHKREKN